MNFTERAAGFVPAAIGRTRDARQDAFMYSEASIFATNSIKLLQTNGRKVTPIKNVAGRMSASEPPAARARHIHLALTVEELALEETFYIFDYGNAM